jgi:hypothetical protein
MEIVLYWIESILLKRHVNLETGYVTHLETGYLQISLVKMMSYWIKVVPKSVTGVFINRLQKRCRETQGNAM